VRFDQRSSSPASGSAISTDRFVEVGLPVVGVLAADIGVALADSLRDPIDISPPQTEQLGLAQSGHRRGEDHDP
jgi:hypothetical protein